MLGLALDFALVDRWDVEPMSHRKNTMDLTRPPVINRFRIMRLVTSIRCNIDILIGKFIKNKL